MINKLGFMQGRLSPIYDNQIQSFPYQNWENEFNQAKNYLLIILNGRWISF